MLNVEKHFVDRGAELALFRRMLDREIAERILLVMTPGEQGKTWLLWRMFGECEQRKMPAVMLDFDVARSGLTDYPGVAREFRCRLGDDHTPAICACEMDLLSAPITPDRADQYRPVMGQALRNDLAGRGAADRFAPLEAGLDRLLARMGPEHPRRNEALTLRRRLADTLALARKGLDTPTVRAERYEILELLNAFAREVLKADFDALCGPQETPEPPTPIVVLIDTFEKTLEETRAWLERWLFDPLRSDLAHVFVVVAGRPEEGCRSFFERPCLWSGLVTCIEGFAPFSDADIMDYHEKRGCTVTEAELQTLRPVAHMSPKLMAGVADALLEKGGRR